jgi:2,3-bisphosphoglycerate-independent phosphoglycerate mutase
MNQLKQPVLLCIMDGYGLAAADSANAIAAAKTPRLDALFAQYPHTQIGASGMDVGLPGGQMGNSEVGHMNIGAGRVVYQQLTLITKFIQDGWFFSNPALLRAVESAKKTGAALHLMGLLSDGGVHSHNTHLYALLELAKRHGLQKVYIHCLLDGRDVPPTSGANFLDELQEKINEIGVGKIATVCGRYYAMDRDNRWERVSKAYAALTRAEGVRADDAAAAVRQSYTELDEEGKHRTDEFVLPTVIDPEGVIRTNDSVVFFNFRPDRAREITRAFVDPAFDAFPREQLDLTYVCMARYDVTMPNVLVAYPPEALEQDMGNLLGQVLSAAGLKQLRIAETEKYAHVTFFFDGGAETAYPGEDRILIPSPKVPTYDLQPEMSACLVADKAVEVIEQDLYDVIILNFANCDMVGHTGIFAAAVAAVNAVDACVGRVWDALRKKNGVLLLTADHGNADHMTESDGAPFTAHTTNPVPFLIAGYDCAFHTDGNGKLCDIAPTLLNILGLEQPEEMTGRLLFAEEK